MYIYKLLFVFIILQDRENTKQLCWSSIYIDRQKSVLPYMEFYQAKLYISGGIYSYDYEIDVLLVVLGC
jgi:hypothetical protein